MGITATISYRLSPQGRQDSLRKGGNGKKEQKQTDEVQPTDIWLFEIDDDGNATFDATRSPEKFPTDEFHVSSKPDFLGWMDIEWDIAPTWGQLLEFARWVNGVELRLAEEHEGSLVAQALEVNAEEHAVGANFLSDPNARAEKVEEDSVTIAGIDFWDSKIVEEAKRRWAADREKIKQENRSTLAGWIREHGTDNQRQRLDAGLLPWQEASDGLEQYLFEPLTAFPLYERFDRTEVCKCVGDEYQAKVCEVKFKSFDATVLSAEEWDRYTHIRDAVPDAQFQLREHQAACHSVENPLIRRGVIVKRTVGWLTYKREYALTPVV